MNPETPIQNAIIAELNRLHIFNWRVSSANQTGFPDVMAHYKGILIGIEVKTATGSPTKLQSAILAEINNNGGIGVIMRDKKEVEPLIKSLALIEPSILWN